MEPVLPAQVSVVEEVSNGEMLLRTGETVMTIMREFQARGLATAPTYLPPALQAPGNCAPPNHLREPPESWPVAQCRACM